MMSEHHKKSSSRPIPGVSEASSSSSRRIRHEHYGPVSQSVPLRSSNAKGSHRSCPRPPHYRPLDTPSNDPPKCTLPPSPQEFNITELESVMEGRKMSEPDHHNARSLPSEMEFEQMSRSLGQHSYGRYVGPTVSPLLETPSPEESLAEDISELNLSHSHSATVLSFMVSGSLDSQGGSDDGRYPMDTTLSRASSNSSRQDGGWELPAPYQGGRRSQRGEFDLYERSTSHDRDEYPNTGLQFHMDPN